MKKKQQKTNKKNGIAKALRTPKYKLQVISDKRKKEDEKRLRKLERECLVHLRKAMKATWESIALDKEYTHDPS